MGEFSMQETVDVSVIEAVETELEALFPVSYVEFLYKNSDGGEGIDNTGRYLYLWRCEDIAQYNKDYEVRKYLGKEVVAFGMDGDRGYFFDCRGQGEPQIASCEFGDMDIVRLKHEADSFEAFIQPWL